MRRYDHKPDEAWIFRAYDSDRSGIERVRRTVERSGRQGRLHVFDVAISTAVQAAQYGWALGEPVEMLAEWLAEAAAWADEALERGQVLDARRAEWGLVAALLAADDGVAERVAAGVPEGGFDDDAAVGGEYLDGLARLIRGDDDGAGAAAAAMAEAGRSPAARPETAEAFEHLDDLLGAVAAGDQGAFDAAVAARTASLVRQFKRSVENRRHADGVLDRRGAALAALARRRGLALPDNDYLATELVRAAG